MRKLIKDYSGSVVPPILFILCIFGGGALYTLFFIEIGIPVMNAWFPVESSDSKTYIFMIIYSIPIIITLVLLGALFLSGLKKQIPGGL